MSGLNPEIEANLQPVPVPEPNASAEVDSPRVLTFVDCDNPFTWAAIATPEAMATEDADIDHIAYAAGNLDGAKDNLLQVQNALRPGETVRLPKGFAYREPIFQGVKAVDLHDLAGDHADYAVLNIEYDHYLLHHLDPGVPMHLLALSLPKYLVEDPEGIGNFEAMFQKALQDRQGESPHQVLNSFRVIDWRSFVVSPDPASSTS